MAKRGKVDMVSGKAKASAKPEANKAKSKFKKTKGKSEEKKSAATVAMVQNKFKKPKFLHFDFSFPTSNVFKT